MECRENKALRKYCFEVKCQLNVILAPSMRRENSKRNLFKRETKRGGARSSEGATGAERDVWGMGSTGELFPGYSDLLQHSSAIAPLHGGSRQWKSVNSFI